MGYILETTSNFVIKSKCLKWAWTIHPPLTIRPPLIVGLEMNIIELLGPCILIHKVISIASMSLEICKRGLQNKVGGEMVPCTLTTPTHYQNIIKLNTIIVGPELPIMGFDCRWHLNVTMFINQQHRCKFIHESVIEH